MLVKGCGEQWRYRGRDSGSATPDSGVLWYSYGYGELSHRREHLEQVKGGRKAAQIRDHVFAMSSESNLLSKRSDMKVKTKSTVSRRSQWQVITRRDA